MNFILFSKSLKALTTTQYIRKALELGVDGFDLCVRPGYAINPDNIEEMLPPFADACRRAGIVVAMVTTELSDPANPVTAKYLQAMDRAGVRMAKLAYSLFARHNTHDYWTEAERLREKVEAWGGLAEKHHVKLVYHTHSADEDGTNYMGSNASGLMHLLKGFDPRFLGAFLDPAHLRVGGESFDFAVNMTGKYLSAVALKDVSLAWDARHNRVHRNWNKAGEGMVEWDLVFSELVRLAFSGPLSICAEYSAKDEGEFFAHLPREIEFFKDKLTQARKHTPKLENVKPGA